MSAATRAKSGDHNPGIAVIAAILLAQFALVSYTFPLSELLSEKPLLHIDAPFHLYQSALAKNLANDGNLVGYDPYFAAGYAAGATYNLSARFPALLAVILAPFVNAIVAYKLHSFIGALIAIACVPLAARLLTSDSRAVLIAALIGLFLWWVSVFRWYHTAGMVSFVTAAYLALPYLALIFRYLTGRQIVGPLGLGVLGAFGFFYHPLFPIPVALATLVFLALSRREITGRRAANAVIVVPALSMLPNLIWLFPAFHYGTLFSDSQLNAPPHQQITDVNLVWQELLGWWKGYAQGSKIYLPLAVFSLLAWVGCRDDGERKLVQTFTLTGVLLVLFAAVGSLLPALGENLQPNRFAPAGYLMMVFPAALALARLSFKRSRWRIAAGGILLASAAGLVLVYELVREVSYKDVGHYGVIPPEVDGPGAYSQWLLPKLKEQTGSDARVLFETSNGRVHDGGHMAGYYAYMTDREFIGGPYPFMHFASFWDGRLLNRPVSEFSPEEFSRYAELYNIGWMVLHSDASKEHLGTMRGVTLIEEFGKLRFYRLDRLFSFFLEGEGRIAERSHNRLRLSDVRGDVVVLKYYYVPGLQTEPRAGIEGITLSDDPTPFIKIKDPPSALTIYLP
ncbi:MAG: hypothetical protein ACREV9_16475 [Burkholderiales bacterium]